MFFARTKMGKTGGSMRRGAPRPLAMTAAFALLGGMLGLGAAVVAPSAAQAAVPGFVCTTDIYTVSATGSINRVDPTTGAASANGQFTVPADHIVNGLALPEGGGEYAWAFDRTSGEVLRFDAATETTSAYATGIPDSAAVIAGAIDPTTGIYYFASSAAVWNLYAFDTSSQTMIGQVGTISGLSLNGDMAFDAVGDLYVVSNSSTIAAGMFSRVNAPIPTTAGNQALVAESITSTPANSGQYNSVAVASDGSIAIGAGTRITRVRPEDGVTLSQVTTAAAFVDFASCAYPNLVYAQKELPNGRYLPTDQFQLEIAGPSVVNEYIGTTEGTDSGLQDLPVETAGPVLGIDGATFTVTETGVGTTDLANYTTTWECRNRTTDTVLASGDGTVGTFTLPRIPSASEVYCIFTNVAQLPALTLDKRVSEIVDVNGNGYTDEGDQILWVFDLANTGNTTLTDVAVTDDILTAVGIGVTCDPTTLAPGDVVTCEADGPYTITATDVDNGQVVNTATATGTPPGQPPVVTPPDTTTTPVAGYTVVKSSDPASGTAVEAGDTVTYTLTVSHRGTATVVDAHLSDDLSDVLDDATYNDDAVASSGTVLVDEGTGELTWSGDLDDGAVVTITYSVTVTNAGNSLLANVVTSPGCTDSCTTENPIGGYVFAKSSDPATGSAVATGSTITYTVTVSQTGEAAVTDASVTDDLSDVLDDATWNGDQSASSGTLTRTGNTLAWSGDLAVGQVVTITYSVTVTGAGDRDIANVVTTDDPAGTCDASAVCATDHHVPQPTGLAITGGTVAWTVIAAGGVALLIGAALLIAARRRRRDHVDEDS